MYSILYVIHSRPEKLFKRFIKNLGILTSFKVNSLSTRAMFNTADNNHNPDDNANYCTVSVFFCDYDIHRS